MEFDYSWVSQLRMVGLVAVAALLGAVVGFDREASDKPAGLRTHMLVAAAAATIAAMGRAVFFDAGGMAGDPNRPLQAVVMGIGFLGAGTILRREREVEVTGLTTAASLFFAAAIGVAAGFDLVPMAVGATVIAVLTLVGLAWLGRRLDWYEEHHRKRRSDDR